MNTVLKDLLDELEPEQFNEFKADRMLNQIYTMSEDMSSDDIVANAQAVASAAMLRYLYPRKSGITEWTGVQDVRVNSSTSDAPAASAESDAPAPEPEAGKPAVKLAEPAPEYDLSNPDSLPLWMKMKLKKEGKL